MQTRRGSRRPGFTLIEMLVVLAIVALMLSIAAPRYFGSLKHSKDVVLKDSLTIVRGSIDSFRGDKGRYPNDLQELVTEHYLRAIPLDPITDSDKSWTLIPSADPQTSGIVDIKSGAPGAASDGTPYAQY